MSSITFEGSNCFRQRLVLSVLTGKTLIINKIRHKDIESGINESEMNLLKLIEKVTNGSNIYVDESGTQLRFKPGILFGGQIDHNCGLDRSIAYYIEVLLMLSPFCKRPIEATLEGITNDQIDASVDAIKHSSLSVIKRFLGAADNNELEIKIVSRGLRPLGGGTVTFKCPVRRVLRPLQLLESGKVKRIRGVAFATRVSPQMANRMVDIAKGILLKYIPDIYIYTDHLKGKNSGKSPGFGLSLVAETTNGVFYTGEAVSNPSGSGKELSVPEDIAKEAAHSLLNDIYRGGAVDTLNQGMTALFMAFGQRDLSKVQFGPLSPYTIQLLRHIKEFLELTFKLESSQSNTDYNEDIENEYKTGSKKIIATCIGIGFTNLSKTVS
jgi:RNA 3'-terminal phosphate cyclase-like protein